VITSRNPMKDKVAVAGAATTGFTPKNTSRSPASYAAQACIAVLRQCGLGASDVDGICGSIPSAVHMQATLGIPQVTWYANPVIPFVNQLSAAAAAVYSGMCDVVLAYHVGYRMAWNTPSALKDPFRRGMVLASGGALPVPEDVSGGIGYTAWASRYMHEFDAPKEHFGYIAINDRSNAAGNPGAAMRDPITMDDYLAARMIRWPLCLLDMDVPVDGADAFVITTAERAKDLPLRPVLVNAMALGMVEKNEEDQQESLRHHGQQVVVEALKAKGDFWIDDVDVYFPYDGFTAITLNWIENAGWCGPGEAGAFIEQHWDTPTARILINGRIPVNPHGGALSEGATQGSGHLREAVHQLQGLAGARQVEGGRRAIVTAGGFFFNAQGVTLRVD
jgi:acetyl-CoA acetyltransferase